MQAVSLVWITPNAEKHIAYCARVSNPKNQASDKISRLIRYCADNKHWSIFEMASMCVEINTSRAISAQILRHRSFHFQEFSQRYAALDATGVVIYAARRQDVKNRQNSIDDLPHKIKAEWEQRQQDNWQRAFEHYTWALNNGIAKECARMVLPIQASTKMYMQGTIRDFVHYILVRTHESAQLEHRQIAEEIKKIFIEQLPVVSEALGWTE